MSTGSSVRSNAEPTNCDRPRRAEETNSQAVQWLPTIRGCARSTQPRRTSAPFEPEFVRCGSASAVRPTHTTVSSNRSSHHFDAVVESVGPLEPRTTRCGSVSPVNPAGAVVSSDQRLHPLDAVLLGICPPSKGDGRGASATMQGDNAIANGSRAACCIPHEKGDDRSTENRSQDRLG